MNPAVYPSAPGEAQDVAELLELGDALLQLDRTWRIVRVNRRQELLSRKPRSETVGRLFAEVWPELATPESQYWREYHRCMGERVPVQFEAYFAPHDAWFSVAAEPLRDGGVAVFFRDVTERRRGEEALREANERLREADRRKDEFLGMLSHELRNPLAPIRNALWILDHAPPEGQQARRAKDIASRQVGHLTRIVDDLLDVTRIARGKIELRHEDLDLAALARRTAEDYRPLMQDRGLELAVQVPRDAVVVNGDPTRLTQVLGNLLNNAAKFTPSGGRVTLGVRAESGRAEILVRDTGDGVEPDLLRTIFEPFTQGKKTLARSEGGLGLGLALVKGLVALHGGEVTAASDGPGRGTTFVVTLPLARAAARDARQEVVATRSTSSRRRVLVVDDNRDAADSLAELLEMLGHEVEVAHDGPSAISRARAHPPEIVLCDIGLPGMDGYAVGRELRSGGGRSARLYVVSGYAQPEDVAAAEAAGFDGHLAKPLDPERLARILD